MANAKTTSSAHTPGPWIWGPSEYKDVYNGELHYAVISHPMKSSGLVVADIETQHGKETGLANARLIAAAPDLYYAACLAREEIDQWIEILGGIEAVEDPRTLEAVRFLKQAIASAEGRA